LAVYFEYLAVWHLLFSARASPAFTFFLQQKKVNKKCRRCFMFLTLRQPQNAKPKKLSLIVRSFDWPL
jgi:hypothetical protein